MSIIISLSRAKRVSGGGEVLARDIRHTKPLNFHEIMDTIGANLQAVRQRIARAAVACGRRAQDVGLIAVSKTFGADAVAAAYAHGQRRFGERSVQEDIAKKSELAHMELEVAMGAPNSLMTAQHGHQDARDHSIGAAPAEGRLLGPIEWHFIGPIQSNKTRVIAENFDWVHSVDRLKIAE